MYILGVNISHHASICLLKDGEIELFLEEERISKIKHHPTGSSQVLKSITHLPVDKIDAIILSASKKSDLIINSPILNQISSLTHNQYYFYPEHHLYHASNAFYSSGFSEACSLVLDGSGYNTFLNFDEIESIYLCSYNKFEPIYKHSSSKNKTTNFSIIKDGSILSDTMSCGNLFNRITLSVGLKTSEVGKVMGMSSYGIVTDDRDWFFYDANIDTWRTDNKILNQVLNEKHVTFQSKANVAKKAQEETKKHTIRLLKKCFEYSDHVVLSGGYFQNCVNNYEYVKMFPDKHFYIDPICHDGGTSMGAAKYLWHQISNDKTIRKLNTLYLG